MHLIDEEGDAADDEVEVLLAAVDEVDVVVLVDVVVSGAAV